MKIAVLTSGIMPVPAVKGGAVENLADFYLDYNNRHHLHDITVYSVWHPLVQEHPALKSEVNHYVYLKTDTTYAKIRKRLFHLAHNRSEYYHYTVEYYLDWALREIKRQPYDIILIENRPAYALKMVKAGNTKIVCHLGNDFLNKTTRLHQQIYDATDRFISCSRFINCKVQELNTKDTKCKTVYNGIDIERFHQARPFDRSALGMDDKDFIIIYSGRLVPEKGILELLQAIKRLNDIPRLKLIILGASAYGKDQHKSPFIAQLEKESEPIKDQVIYTGFVDYQLVPSYLKMADVAVVPSMWDEPFGLTVVEAMAAGLPLVTTSSGGIPEICQGIAEVIDREDVVPHLSAALRGLYQDPGKRKAMGLASVEHSKLFSKQMFAEEFFKAIATLDHI